MKSKDSPPGQLPRLPREYYQGDAMVHWTQATFDRATGWRTEAFHTQFRELMLHAAAREGLLCPAYCLMPDHLHLIWVGLRRESDQRNGMAFLRTYLEPALGAAKFQPQPHDSVLRQPEREHDAFEKVCHCILANPVEGGHVACPEDWVWNGAVIPGYPNLHPLQPDFWSKFWKIFARMRHPDAGEIQRPPF